MNKNDETSFGFRTVDHKTKERLVHGVFKNVASKYDIMNDIMSFGMHHLWKSRLMRELMPCSSHILLDVASGTMDIARKYLAGGGQKVVASDINQSMLDAGQKRMEQDNFAHKDRMDMVCCNAEELPFDDDSFDYYTISFGIRNVSDIDRALREAYRVLKPGGKLVCLEFSNVNSDKIAALYRFYTLKVIPQIGRIVASDAESYRYLAESIVKFPKAAAFKQMIMRAGFENVKFEKMTFGVVALHTGYKI